MGVLSKFSPTNWKSGGFGKGDFHVWVETPYGEVIDPYFKQHQGVCSLRGLDINKRRFQEWDDQERWLKEHHITGALEDWNKPDYPRFESQYPIWARCGVNALINYFKNPNYYRIVVGSAGWGKKGRSNVVWYEYG